jgi:predicted transcriptional regulator
MEKEKFEVTSKKYKGDSSVISLRLSNDLISKFDEIAKETGRTRNEIFSMALEFALENLEIKK